MRALFVLISIVLSVGCPAQEQTIPTRRILPDDIEQDSIKVVQFSTNRFAVRFTYTESGARKMLAFRHEHSGCEFMLQVDGFQRRGKIAPVSVRPQGWTEEGYLRHRGDKLFGVSQEDAEKIVAGLRTK
jgi:hypothetical protein